MGVSYYAGALEKFYVSVEDAFGFFGGESYNLPSKLDFIYRDEGGATYHASFEREALYDILLRRKLAREKQEHDPEDDDTVGSEGAKK